MAQATETKTAAPVQTETPANKSVSATVPYDVWDALEGYAFGTRQKLTKVIAQAVVEFYEKNKTEIDSKRV